MQYVCTKHLNTTIWENILHVTNDFIITCPPLQTICINPWRQRTFHKHMTPQYWCAYFVFTGIIPHNMNQQYLMTTARTVSTTPVLLDIHFTLREQPVWLCTSQSTSTMYRCPLTPITMSSCSDVLVFLEQHLEKRHFSSQMPMKMKILYSIPIIIPFAWPDGPCVPRWGDAFSEIASKIRIRRATASKKHHKTGTGPLPLHRNCVFSVFFAWVWQIESKNRRFFTNSR